MSPKLHPIYDLLAVVSGAGAITAWQEQIDWWLRVGASVVAIIAGLAALRAQMRKRKH